MANITVSVPAEVLRQARIRAAERGTSVSGMVREFLVSLTEDEEMFRRLEGLQTQVFEEIGHFCAADRLGRDDLHARAR